MTTTLERLEAKPMQPALMPAVYPITYSMERTRCVCDNDTLSKCRQCDMPACGNCLDTPRHAARFHAAA